MLARIMSMLIYFEGLSTEAYQDTGGAWTIGYGHFLGHGDQPEIRTVTQEEALQILKQDVSDAIDGANDLRAIYDVPEKYTEALVHMVFQLGYTSTCQFQDMLDSMCLEQSLCAAKDAMESLWRKQTPIRAGYVAGLISIAK